MSLRADPETGLLHYDAGVGIIDNIDDSEHRCLLLSMVVDGDKKEWAVLRLSHIERIDASRVQMCVDKDG